MHVESKISGLDGLRGLAALMVFLTHMANWNQHLIPGWNFGGLGRSGVLLFFVLSAFLLTSQIMKWAEHEGFSMARWREFLSGRILRIWPTYLVVLIVAVFTSHLDLVPGLWRWQWALEGLPVRMSLDSFWEHLLLQRGEDVLWTIPVEFKFYLALPFILLIGLWIVPRHRYRWSLLLALAVIAICVANAYIPNFHDQSNPIPFLDVFLVGIALAFARLALISTVPISTFAKFAFEGCAWLTLTAHIVLTPALFAAMFGIMVPVSGENAQLFFSLLWAVLIFSMLFGTGFMRRILDTPLLTYFGLISYDLYLWHRVGNYGLSRLNYYERIQFIPESLKPAITFLFVIILSTLSYFAVARPVQSWRRRHLRELREDTHHAKVFPI